MYLENQTEIQKLSDIRRLSDRNKKLGKAALLEIIAGHPSDPVVKVYARGYPL